MLFNLKKRKEIKKLNNQIADKKAELYTIREHNSDVAFIREHNLYWMQENMMEDYFADINNNKLVDGKDFEVDQGTTGKLVIFYNKDLSDQPFHYRKNDFERKYYRRGIRVGTVLKKIRQQRTQGQLDGHSRINFHHSGGLFSSSVDANGYGNINGNLDTTDEFILAINFNNKNMEVRVSANLFYLAEEKDDLYMYDYSFTPDDYSAVKYNIDEIQAAAIKEAEITKLKAQQTAMHNRETELLSQIEDLEYKVTELKK